MHSEKVSTATSTSSSENRKNSKPIMEKRRRARMNASLTELKSLLLEVMKKEGNRHSKMEKADILEMTVKQLRHLQRQHFSASANEEPVVFTKYVMGFQECASEVSRYLSSMAEIEPDIRTRLLNHLATYITTTPTLSNSSPKRLSSSPSLSSTGPMSRPSSASENSSCPSPDKDTSSPPSPSRHISLTKVPGMIASSSSPSSLSSSPPPPAHHSSDSKQTAPSATANVTGVTNGTLTVDPALSQIHASKLGGVQLLATKMPNCQVAFVLPASVMTEDRQQTLHQQQNYFPLPIYAPTSQATFAPLTTPASSSGTMMTLMPEMPKSGISLASLSNMGAVPQLISFPGTLPGSLSSNTHILVNSTDIYKQFELSSESSPQISPLEMKKPLSPPAPVTKQNSRNHIVVHKEPSAIRVGEDENVWRPW